MMTIESDRTRRRWKKPSPSNGEESDHLEDSLLSRPRKSARDKMMDYLARRNHSELELRQKLSRAYTQNEVENAIAFAYENNWMAPPEEISERLAAELDRKRKGHRFINQVLKSKGLPHVTKNLEEEVRKGRALVTSKLAKEGPFSFEEQKKIHRWLTNRGFDSETIRKVIHSTIDQS